MYSEIHQLKQIGLKKAQVARKLEIDVKTVSKYWEATPDEFAAMRQKSKSRSKKLKHYRDIILKWLRENPDLLVVRYWTGSRSTTMIFQCAKGP